MSDNNLPRILKLLGNISIKGITCFAALILCILTVRTVWPQQQKPAEQAQNQAGFKIGVEVNMVTVPITIRRPEGGFIKGLPQSVFHIYEDGVEQEITFFAQEGLPTHIALVLDTSGSVRSEWGTIRFSTKKFIENLKPDDQFAILAFSTDVRLKMDWGRNSDRLDAVLSSIYCKDNTKLWDAIYVASTDVLKEIKEKKAMIIMSDGLDNESSITYEEAVDAAVRSEAAVYVVSKTQAVRQMIMSSMTQQRIYENLPDEIFEQADQALRKLAYETGGRVLYPNNFGQLNDIYAQVNEELRNQYTLGYISSNSVKDGSYRRIEVRVAEPNATISARPGYYAPNEISSRPSSMLKTR